jgi:hypothetical protein
MSCTYSVSSVPSGSAITSSSFEGSVFRPDSVGGYGLVVALGNAKLPVSLIVFSTKIYDNLATYRDRPDLGVRPPAARRLLLQNLATHLPTEKLLAWIDAGTWAPAGVDARFQQYGGDG